MSDVTTCRCWPACPNAIDWSADGIIAFASDEEIMLLFPQIESQDTKQDGTSWHHLPLPVSWFTTSELPVKEAAPVSTYSIGEEVSSSAPILSTWSPPGVAKHRRCALGVLTSSLVFSIWASEGKVQEESSWKRRLVINHALESYFLTNATEEESNLVRNLTERLRLRSRVRCFAWAPALPSPPATAMMGTQSTYGQPFVAVSNEDNQIVFVAVNSPTTTLGVDKEWSATVKNHISIVPEFENVFTNPNTFDEIMLTQRHMSHLAWSPWAEDGDWHYSVLVYATNEDVRARVVTYNSEQIELDDYEITYPDLQLRHTGPMKWSSRVEDGYKVTLALFTLSGVTVLTVSAKNAEILARRTHDLDGRWDEISGVVWDYTTDEPSLHFASLQCTLNHPTAGLGLSSDKLSTMPWPNWREQLTDSQALFSIQKELRGNVRTKVWGLSSSPLGDFIATLSTRHPSDMIEYGPPATRRSTIAISGLCIYSQQTTIDIPKQNFDAEGLSFTLQKWIESTLHGEDLAASIVEEVASKIFQNHWKPNPRLPSESYTFSSSPDALRPLITETKRAIFLNEHTIKDRCTILVSELCSPSASTSLPRTLIAYRLATSALNLPKELAKRTPFSAEIHVYHRRVVALIDTVMSAEDPPEPESQSTNNSTSSAQNILTQPCDTCDFCEADIPFTDLISAACTNGHLFPRCGLSFLAIQAPRMTKYCGICKTPFLSEECVRVQEMGSRESSRESSPGPEGLLESVDGAETEGGDVVMAEAPGSGAMKGREMPVSLARVLFLACDACVYCGGKFTG